MNRNIILISSLLFLQILTSCVEANSPSSSSLQIAKTSKDEVEGDLESYSTQELQILASQITVKIIGDHGGGSGVLIGKQGNNYLVLTNSHVIRGANSVKLQAPVSPASPEETRKTYSAQIVPENNFDFADLVLLKFQSNQSYDLPEISEVTPDIDTPILAAGFSVSTGNIVFHSGKVEKTSNLKEGYEIGYSSKIEQGMSGGAILNSMGELVGINGRSAYPILNTGYVYQNGSRPSFEEIKEMRKLNWGIPISTVLAQVNRDVLTAYNLPFPGNAPNVPEVVELTGWLEDLEQKAKKFTVRIDSSSKANGSGIIIAKQGNTYTVLTAAHVVCESENGTPPCPNNSYEILAPDGKKYPVDKSSIKQESGVDLAVVKFNSSQNYQIATIANYNSTNGDYIFTAGYPKLKNNSPWRFTVGVIFDKERGLLQTNQFDFQNDDSGRLQSASSLTGGYELVYSSITYGGMSGGPVLDSQGRIIGIHGRTEGEFQLGYSLGVPVSTFLALAPRLGVKPQLLENDRPPQLNAQKQKSITQAVLSANVSGGNATASEWLERGNQLWRLRRYEEAVKAFDEVIKQKPSFAYLAYYGKGLVLGWRGNTQEGLAALEQAVKLKPDFVDAWTIQSAGYRELKKLDKALVAINKAIELQPQNPNLYNQKGVVLKDLKQYAQSEAAITRAIKLSPRAAFYNNRGLLYSNQKKWELALLDYNKAIQINPNLVQAYNNRGLLYSNQKKWELALVDYNKAIQINPEYATAYNNRGIVYSDQKKWELALADYNKAIQINPNDDGAYNNRGELYRRQKKWELALLDYNKAIQINPNLVQAYNNRGIVYSDQKKWELALADFNKIIQINPEYATAYINRGVIYDEQKKWELAMADFNKAIQINPDAPEAYNNRGVLYLKQKKWELALTDFNKAIQINPDDHEAYNNRGNLYEEQKKSDLALADYNKAIQINPNYALAYYNRGELYRHQKKWELALADNNKAIQINPDLARAYNNRGIIYYVYQKWELALADFNKAIQINPDLARAYSNRGVLYLKQKKWELALTDLNKAIQINPEYDEAYYNRGNLYLEQKKWELALTNYNKAIQTNPKYAKAYANRGLILIQIGNKQKGIQDLQKAAQLFKEQGNTASYEKAMILLQTLQKYSNPK